MKHLRYCFGLALLLAGSARAQGPTPDPTFRMGAVYQPAPVPQALRQPDGKLLLVTPATNVGGRPANGQLSRLLANSDQVDTVFATNVAGLQGNVLQAAVRPDNHIILITGRGSLSLGGVTRLGILGLNPDGTVDTGFNAITTASFSLSAVVAQPDGKVLVAAYAGTWSSGVISRGLIRLLPSGSVDMAFTAALGQGFVNPFVYFLALQANGSIMVGGSFDQVDGAAQGWLARLRPSGAFDSSFRPVLPLPVANNSPTVIWYPVGAITQPDGKVVVAVFTNQSRPDLPPLLRLLPSGAVDPTFQPGSNFAQTFSYIQRSSPLCLLPNGRLLVGNSAGFFNGRAVGQLVRLTAAGRLDTTFANGLVAAPGIRNSLDAPAALSPMLLPSGQVLVAGTPARYSGEAIARPLARLDSASGGRDPAFAPRVHLPGEVRDVLRQPDGRYLLGGLFTEIDGQPASYLARLGPGGALEPAFANAAAPDNPVNSLVLQADGKVLLGGAFQTLGGALAPGVGRLLPGGAPDPAFAATLPPGTLPNAIVEQVALEPGGSVLLRGSTFAPVVQNSSLQPLIRLSGQTGQYDPNFSPNYYSPDILLVQPDGRLLLAGYRIKVGGQGAVSLVRLLANGTLDPTFITYSPDHSLKTLALDPATGDIYAAGQLQNLPAVLRFSPTGTRDTGYAPTLPPNGQGMTLAVQPNGRLLLGGRFALNAAGLTTVGLVRLLPSGATDPSFTPALGPNPEVRKVLAQADGAIVAAGTFTQVGTAPLGSMARLLAPIGLAVGSPATNADALAVWPVPTTEMLHLRWPARGGAAQVSLFDTRGRLVRALHVPAGQVADLPVAGLPAGLYVLRVVNETGAATRRVALGL